jgi:hypothetical protein
MTRRSVAQKQGGVNETVPQGPPNGLDPGKVVPVPEAGPGSNEPADPPQDQTATAGPPPDPFDPARLRLSQDFAATLGVKKALLTVPVRKPAKEWWIRTHPDESYRIETAVLELKEERETYLVERSLWSGLFTESTFSPRALFTAVNRQGVVFLWPIRLPESDGRHDEWSRSALEAAMTGAKKWVRVTANMSLGAYEVWTAEGSMPEPEWPEQSFGELLRVAFRDRYVESLDHPVVRRLRGEL